MNFYKHHIGDYAQATAHLTFVEDAAYSRMLRKYYADEKPLPVEVKAVQRLIAARARDEREAVVTVLDEFFELCEDGWHNRRADAELAKANAQADTNRRIAEEREARRRERTGNASSHESLNAPVHESLQPQEHESLPVREPSQTPDTRHQTPDLKPGTEDTLRENPARVPTQAGSVCLAIKRAGLGTVNPSDPRLLALLERGATTELFASLVPAALDKRHPWAYLLGAVEGQLTEAAALSTGPRASPAPQRKPSKAEKQAQTIAGLTGHTTERTDHADGQPGAIDVDSRIVG